MTYEYVCYTCGVPSAEPTCESCSTHYQNDSDLPEYGPLTLYDAFIAEGYTHEELIRLNERASMILESMKPVALRYKISK